MRIEKVEQIAALLITAALVMGNFLFFTPWRDGHDPRQRKQTLFKTDQEASLIRFC